MVRFMIEGSPISIAYGFSDINHYFLSVFDKRLEWKEGASEEVNEVADNIGLKDGGGSYFDLHTGTQGSGIKVSNETMKVYLARFGVPKKQIDELFSGRYSKTKPKLENNYKELNCAKSESVCSKCGCVQDWINHKLICDSLPLPVKNPKQKSFNAIYLPEDEDKPVFVLVPIEEIFEKNENFYWDYPQLDFFLGKKKCPRSSYMNKNPLNEKRVMRDKLIITYRDDFLIDGCSKKNRLVEKMTRGKSGHDWRGPIIVMKASGVQFNPYEKYLDIQSSDFVDIVDFFLWYGKCF